MTDHQRDRTLYAVGAVLFATGVSLMGFATGVTATRQACLTQTEQAVERALEEQDNLREGRTLLPPAAKPVKPAKPRLVV